MFISITVIIGYCDTVGEWSKCHNKQFVTILEHFTVLSGVDFCARKCMKTAQTAPPRVFPLSLLHHTITGTQFLIQKSTPLSSFQ